MLQRYSKLLVQTTALQALTNEVIDLVSAIHPYDVPEILSTPVEGDRLQREPAN